MEPQLDNAQVLTSGTDLAENFNLEGNIFTKLFSTPPQSACHVI